MYVKKILYLSRDDDEADIYVSDGRYEVLCYVNPIGALAENREIRAIWGFQCSGIVRVVDHRFSADKLGDHYAYSVTGQVVSRGESVIRLGEITIHLDTGIPGDIREGEYVTFTALRLDAI